MAYSSVISQQDISVTVSGAKDAIEFEAQWKWADATDFGNPVI